MAKIFILIAFALFFAVATVCKPDFLARNTFLLGFVNHEVLALLSVILTVTLASVANIHLTMNKIVANKFGNNPKLKDAATEVKNELKDNCWYIFWGFVAAAILLVAKGSIPNGDLALSIIHGMVLWILALYVLCMYDVYQVVFGIVDMDDGSSGADNTPDMSSDGGDSSA